MTFFRSLGVLAAALGLLFPLGGQAADLNLADINRYAEVDALDGQEQIASITQFSDITPADWAYQALGNLIERYGCVVGDPDGSFKGGQTMTRWEAALLLNACLDRITTVSDAMERLRKGFEAELAVLRGRVHGLQARVGEREAAPFSSTTVLTGDTVFVLGANRFGGSEDRGERTPAESARNFGATVFNYDVRLNLSTSFTGRDLLYTRLRSGNFNSSPFSGRPFNLMALRVFSPAAGPNAVELDRLFYRFPIGSTFTALVGSRARNTEFLAIRPSFYGGRGTNILDVFALHGAPGTYNTATGAALGLMWKQNVERGNPYLAVSTSYIAPTGHHGNPSNGGLFSDGSKGSFTTQIGVAAPQWALAFAWRYGQCGQNFRRGTQFANQVQPCRARASENSAYSNNFAVAAAWQPIDSGWLPSISAGWGYNALTQAGDSAGLNAANNIAASQSWSVGLEWADAFAQGNALGMAVGQPVFATSLRDGATPRDGHFAWEWWYQFQTSDNITITPAVFYLSRPDGQFTTAGKTNHVFGALVQSRIRF